MTATILQFPPDHNSGRWLEVFWQDAHYWWSAPKLGARRDGIVPAGWYVRRTCPCCQGEIVTCRYDTAGEAAHTIAVLIEIDRRLGHLAQRQTASRSANARTASRQRWQLARRLK